jgi:carbon storage regulator CsrA
MLVLSRKRLESVVVGGAVGFERLLKVTVLELEGGSVRLGFEVDSSVPVHRWELWEKIRAGGQSDSPLEDPALQRRWSDEDLNCRPVIRSPDGKLLTKPNLS